MENIVNFESQFASIAEYYNKIVELRRRQKDDGVMIRILLNEIMPMYEKLVKSIEENENIPKNVKERLLEIVKWEMDRAVARDALIEEHESNFKTVFSLDYEGELAENKKLEKPFAIIAAFYNKIDDIRDRQRSDLSATEAISEYERLKNELANHQSLTVGFKEAILTILEAEIEGAYDIEAEINEAERVYAKEYAKAYNAALARYEALSPLLKLKYARQLKSLQDESEFKSLEQINQFFVFERDLKQPESPDSPGGDDEHDGH